MKASTRQTLINILGPLFLTVIAVLGAAEVGFRRFYPLIPLEVCASDPYLGNYICQPLFEYDRPVEIAYKYKPNLLIEGYWDPADPFLTDVGPETRPSDRTEPFWFVLETDEMGFPNSEPIWRDEYDIVVTGDSFTIRTAPVSWIEHLGEVTGDSILTLGAPSWTTLNQVAAVEKFGLDKNPEWVVLLYFEGNDLINVQQYLEKQASGLDWRAYDAQNVPFYRRLVMFHMIQYWVTPAEESEEPVRYRYPVEVASEAGPFDTVLKDTHLLPISADYDTIAASDEWAAVTSSLLSLKTQVEAQGSNLLVVYIPSKEHVYWSRIWDSTDVNNILERTVTVRLSDGDSGRLEWERQILSYDQFNAIHLDQERIFSDFMTEHDFEFLNLTPILWENTIANGEQFHYADPHWNQAGNLLVAEEIAKKIEAR